MLATLAAPPCDPSNAHHMVSRCSLHSRGQGHLVLLWQHKKRSQKFNFFFLSKQSKLLKAHFLFWVTLQAPMFTFCAQFTASTLGRMLERNKTSLPSSMSAAMRGMVCQPRQWKGPKSSLSLPCSINCLAKLLSRHLCFALPCIF